MDKVTYQPLKYDHSALILCISLIIIAYDYFRIKYQIVNAYFQLQQLFRHKVMFNGGLKCEGPELPSCISVSFGNK